jgi:hypothetical protein
MSSEPRAFTGGEYKGWHHACYKKERYICLGEAADCRNAPAGTFAARPANYFTCRPCANINWFESTIRSLKNDDIQRVETQRRLGAAEALEVHTEMRKTHTTFKERGGIIRILGHPNDLPTVTWDRKHIRGVVWPAHIRSDQLYGPAKVVAQAADRSNSMADPYPEG